MKYKDKSLLEGKTVLHINNERKKMWKGINSTRRLELDANDYLNEKIKETDYCFKKITDNIDLNGKKILDLGSGYGFMVVEGRIRGYNIYGLEPDESLNELLKYRLKKNNIDIKYAIKGVGEKIPISDSTFDVIISFSVLEHVKDVKKVLNECYRILKPGGDFYFGCPNYLNFWEDHYKTFFIPFMNKRIARIYFNLLGRDGSYIESINYLSPKSVVESLKKSGFKIVISPIEVLYENFNKKLSSIKSLKKLKSRIIAILLKYTALYLLINKLIKKGFFVKENIFHVKKP